MPLLALAILVILAFIALIPFSIIQRFRVGTSRRQARGWVAMLNLMAIAFSAVLFLVGAFITSRWIPEALTYTLAGFGAGCALGLLGVALTRWEYAGRRLHYTPNRWLVLTITIGRGCSRAVRVLAHLGGVARESREHGVGDRFRSRGIDVGGRRCSRLLPDLLDRRSLADSATRARNRMNGPPT